MGDRASYERLLSTMDSLADDVQKNEGSWENPTVARYLDAMKAWLEAQQRKSPREPSWELIREMLEAGKIYE